MTKKYIFYLLAAGVILFPSFVFAAAPSVFPTGFWGPLVSCTGNGGGGLPSCASMCDLIQTFENVIYFGISVAIFIIAPILFAWGGIMYMISRGKPEGTGAAKKILTGALIGVLIVLGGWLIVNTFVGVLGISGIGGFGSGGTCTLQVSAPSSGSSGSGNNNSEPNLNLINPPLPSTPSGCTADTTTGKCVSNNPNVTCTGFPNCTAVSLNSTPYVAPDCEKVNGNCVDLHSTGEGCSIGCSNPPYCGFNSADKCADLNNTGEVCIVANDGSCVDSGSK